MNSRVRVTLACLVEEGGFVGLCRVRVRAQEESNFDRREIGSVLEELSRDTRISHDLNPSIVKLNAEYYNEYRDPNNPNDLSLNFALYVVDSL